MNKTIKSEVRKLLFCMISKYEEKKLVKQAVLREKQDCLRTVTVFLDSLEDNARTAEVKQAIKKITDLDQKDMMKSQNQYLEELSSLTDVSVITLKRIKKEGAVNEGVWRTPGKKRPHPSKVSNLDSFDMDVIRNKINEFYIVRKQVPTLRSLLVELKESIEFGGCRETLRRILLANGYVFKKNKNERSLLIERYDIAAWRHRFLRTIASKRAEGKPIIYLDETYVHKTYKPKKCWQGPSTSGIVENISSGKRYIIVHAGSEKGPVPNSLLVFSTKSKMADYHHDMNSTNFNKWLQEKLMPNLNEPCVIVMDNASYHSVIINKAPTSQNRKLEIQNWLTLNGISFETYNSKAELLCLVKQNTPEPIYEADELLSLNGHEVLRLPPYHCDLNAIPIPKCYRTHMESSKKKCGKQKCKPNSKRVRGSHKTIF
ncbi:unnamed protein product [Arctia plantaginis]|uniref:Tc1-like transposase DDE domain-containing protein n=1 Tax=Arctia plantaginis TaxID=874455 RepID=A0A8S1B2R7_ARCPL|nr:unnamed protein product [Arctia plantaginis]